MNRQQMIEKAARALYESNSGGVWDECDPYAAGEAREDAVAVLDVILPQITTVEELEALPVGTLAVSAGGTVVTRTSDPFDPKSRIVQAVSALLARGPLTVVYRPDGAK